MDLPLQLLFITQTLYSGARRTSLSKLPSRHSATHLFYGYKLQNEVGKLLVIYAGPSPWTLQILLKKIMVLFCVCVCEANGSSRCLLTLHHPYLEAVLAEGGHLASVSNVSQAIPTTVLSLGDKPGSRVQKVRTSLLPYSQLW